MLEPQVSQSQSQLIKDIFANIAPLLADISLTPDKLREALKPYVDPAAVARELRERQQMREQFLEATAQQKAMQDACPHKDRNEKWAINLTHNFPDHMPRGTCPICQSFIEPAHWEIPGSGFDGGNGKGVPYVVKEHPLYHVVKFLESQS